MKCELCKKELDAYREGLLPEGTRALVDAHHIECKECTAFYLVEGIANKVMDEEKNLQSNPFLATRIMAGIEQLEHERESIQIIPDYLKVLKPVLIGISIAAAVVLGIFAGSVYQPNIPSAGIPQELAYINDANMEAIAMLTNE